MFFFLLLELSDFGRTANSDSIATVNTRRSTSLPCCMLRLLGDGWGPTHVVSDPTAGHDSTGPERNLARLERQLRSMVWSGHAGLEHLRASVKYAGDLAHLKFENSSRTLHHRID